MSFISYLGKWTLVLEEYGSNSSYFKICLKFFPKKNILFGYFIKKFMLKRHKYIQIAQLTS